MRLPPRAFIVCLAALLLASVVSPAAAADAASAPPAPDSSAYARGVSLLRHARHHAAAAAFAEFLRGSRDPRAYRAVAGAYLDVLVDLGLAYAASGKWANVSRVYQRLKSLDPVGAEEFSRIAVARDRFIP